MSKSQRDKGARIERQARDLLREYGFRAERGGHSQAGGHFVGDVDSPDLPSFHFEVKGRKSLALYKWLDQAEDDCHGKAPIVLAKGDRRQFVAILPAEVLMEILRRSDFVKNREDNE